MELEDVGRGVVERVVEGVGVGGEGVEGDGVVNMNWNSSWLNCGTVA
jgi:hypothetical protein